MFKNRLGKSQTEVSILSFGTASIGMPYGIDVGDTPDERQSIQLLRRALDEGINSFDTASDYGISEDLLGRAFTGNRDKVVICSKPSHLYDSFLGQALPGADEIRKRLNDSLAMSLKRLKTDYIDIYMSHDGSDEALESDTITGFFQDLKKKGIIRIAGISVYTPEQSKKAIKSGMWDVIQIAVNLMDQRQLPAIKLAKANGIGVIVRSALFKGILTGRGANLHPKLKSVQAHRDVYNELLDDNTQSLSDLATKFVMSLAGVSSVLVGIDKNEYLDKAISVCDGTQLSDEIIARAKQLAYPEPEFLNLPMWDRNGWL